MVPIFYLKKQYKALAFTYVYCQQTACHQIGCDLSIQQFHRIQVGKLILHLGEE